MPKLKFIPQGTEIEVDENTKILVAATRAKVPIRFGCAACRCGTCGIKIESSGVLSPMAEDEKNLLSRMGLPLDGTVRLACRTRLMSGSVTVDLDFQNTYSPDEGEEVDDNNLGNPKTE